MSLHQRTLGEVQVCATVELPDSARTHTCSLLPGMYLTLCLQVLREIDNATKAFPNAYIRMCAFDASRQVQVASMLVHRPASAKEWRP